MNPMELWTEFLVWAFERHQNVLSWYVRPLFVPLLLLTPLSLGALVLAFWMRSWAARRLRSLSAPTAPAVRPGSPTSAWRGGA